MYFKPCVKYGNKIFGINSVFIGLNVWGINYEPNGSFGNENGVRTRKLGPKRRKREIVQIGQKAGISGRHCPRLCHLGNVAWQGRETLRL